MSFGNNMTEFSFENGLNLISAKNGSGKSSIGPEALSYVLYGKPYRDIKVSELVNRKNKKGMLTEIDFLIDSDLYKIVRGIGPAKLELYKNGNPVESLSSKALNQEEINKLLGIDYKLFKMIIALSVNYNKPFLSLSIPEKREVLESIFNVKVFSEMLKKLKKETIEIKSNKSFNDTNMKNLEGSIIALKRQIKEVEDSIKNFDTNKQNDLDDILKAILDTTKEQTKCKLSEFDR
jgi:DNA repair exonuclease SbcCD ATPase subunit